MRGLLLLLKRCWREVLRHAVPEGEVYARHKRKAWRHMCEWSQGEMALMFLQAIWSHRNIDLATVDVVKNKRSNQSVVWTSTAHVKSGGFSSMRTSASFSLSTVFEPVLWLCWMFSQWDIFIILLMGLRLFRFRLDLVAQAVAVIRGVDVALQRHSYWHEGGRQEIGLPVTQQRPQIA